jgi:predicted aconitase with swiveling domain
MKKIILTITTLLLISSCSDPGTSEILLDDHKNLPTELKGLRVYNVSTGRGSSINVAVLNSDLNSVTYRVGKRNESVILIDKQTDKVVQVSSILMENDSLIICKK